MRIRQHSTGSRHPGAVVQIMRPQIVGAMLAVLAHYRRRHANGRNTCRNWCAEVKRLDAASGYSTALAQLRGVE